MPRAGIFAEKSDFAALGKVSAHNTDDGVAVTLFFCPFDEVGVPVMEGIIFANYAANFHFRLQKTFTFFVGYIIMIAVIACVVLRKAL